MMVMIKKQEGHRPALLVEDEIVADDGDYHISRMSSFTSRVIVALINKGFKNIGSSNTAYFEGIDGERHTNITYAIRCSPSLVSLARILIALTGVIIAEQIENGYGNISWRQKPELGYSTPCTSSLFRRDGWHFHGMTREVWLDRYLVKNDGGFNPLNIIGLPDPESEARGGWIIYARLVMY